MKISIALETLHTGNLRATGRQDGRTVAYFEGGKDEAKKLVNLALKAAAFAHATPSGYDMTHIRMNDAAKNALA